MAYVPNSRGNLGSVGDLYGNRAKPTRAQPRSGSAPSGQQQKIARNIGRNRRATRG